MKKIVCSKWSKRFLWLIIIPTFLIYEYIVLFIGPGNTYIDDICIVSCLIAMGLIFIRSFLIAWYEEVVEENKITYQGTQGTGMSRAFLKPDILNDINEIVVIDPKNELIDNDKIKDKVYNHPEKAIDEFINIKDKKNFKAMNCSDCQCYLCNNMCGKCYKCYRAGYADENDNDYYVQTNESNCDTFEPY